MRNCHKALKGLIRLSSALYSPEGPYKAAREPRKSQKEEQEDQRTFNQLGGTTLALLTLPGPHGLLSGSSWGLIRLLGAL